MTRTSKALRRFGVAGLVAATIGAGLPLLLAAPAHAAPASTVTITPETNSGASNTCQTFTLNVADLAGNPPSEGTVVNVVLTDPAATNTVSFCTVDPATGQATPTTGNNITGTDQTANQDQQRFFIGAGQRQTTFGVFDSEAETVAIRAFIDNSTAAGSGRDRFDVGEPTDTATAVFTAGGGTRNAANDAVRTITEVTPAASATPTAAGGVQNIRVRLTNLAGDEVANAVPSIRTNTGGANSPGTVNNPGTVGTDSGSCTVSDNNGISTCSVVVPNAGTDTFTIFVNQSRGATAGPDAGEPTLVVTRTTAAAPNINVAQARNIDLTPEGPTSTVGGVDRVFTATVTDATGRAVVNVLVTFDIQGAGAGTLTSGGGFTDNLGQVRTTLRSAVGQTGQTVIVATIASDQPGVAGSPASGTQETQCAALAGEGGVPATSTSTAGNCTDAEATNFVASTTSPSPTASPTVTVPPTGAQCTNPAGITLDRTLIRPGTAAKVTVRATPNSIVQLQAYSRPSTTYRVVRTAPVPTSGVVEFMVTPGTNTRLFANCVNQTSSASSSVVLQVRTALSLTVVREGTRTYTFKGTNLPRRANQIISLYRVTSNGNRVLTAQVRTDTSGVYSITRRFTGSGTFGFLTRTGQNLTNAAGESNTPDASTTGIGTPRRTAIF